jgi:hypothetical protein
VAEKSERFMRQVWACESSVEVLLRGHLWIEHFLERILDAKLDRPDEIDLERMRWRQKLALCGATGALSEEEVAALAYVNTIRNQLAHDLGTEPSDMQVTELLARSPTYVLESVGGLRKRVEQKGHTDPSWTDVPPDSALATWRLWFFVTVIRLAWYADNLAYDKEHAKDVAQATGVRLFRNMSSRKDNPMTHAEAEREVGLPPRPKAADWLRTPAPEANGD